jgi:tetratricopeptide (TPR) repeat protein
MRFSSQPEFANAAYEKAKELAATEAAIAPNNPGNFYRHAWAAAGTGDLQMAELLIGRALALAPNSPYTHYFDALIQLELGDRDAALEALSIAVQQGYPVTFLAKDPLLSGLRDERAFRALVGDIDV